MAIGGLVIAGSAAVLAQASKPGVWFATHEQIARYVKTDR
jgi:hypothetical protein